MSRSRARPHLPSGGSRRSPAPDRSRAVVWGIAGALALATLVVYAPVGGFPFLEAFDDGTYVTGNPHVSGGLTPASIAWALTASCAGNWHPLTLLSHMLDCTLFGVTPGPAHVVNLLLHVANVLLLFFGLAALTRAPGRSALVAGLFALHPLHVESVAWIAERKDVLSTLLLLATVGAYVRWTRRPGAPGYALVLGLYALGLAAKPMLVTLPFALLLLDHWPLGRLGAGAGGERQVSPARAALEKLPLVALALGSIALTLRAQAAVGATTGTLRLPLGLRLGNAVLACAGYLGKLFVPVRLVCLYPFPKSVAPLAVAGAAILLAALTAAAVLVRRRAPWALAGWLWYLGTLVPVIGLVQVGNQAMADRYTYVPFLGLTVALVWALAALAGRLRVPPRAQLAAGAAVLLLLAVATSRQLGYWRDPAALFRHCAENTHENYVAANNYGFELLRQGRNADALAQFERALAWNPRHLAAWSNLGTALGAEGRLDEAVRAFAHGVALDPRDVQLQYNLAVGLAMLKRWPEAFPHFEAAVRAAPENEETRQSYSAALGEYGAALAAQGRHAEAVRSLERSLEVDARNTDARRALEHERGVAAPGAAAR